MTTLMVDVGSGASRHSSGRRRSASIRRLGWFLLVWTVVAACSVIQPQTTHGPTAAPGWLTQEAATALAIKALPATPGGVPVVVWASIENDPFAPRGNAAPGSLTWVVRLHGGLAESPCPSGWLERTATTSDPACLDADGGIDVVLDFYSGVVLGWIH